MAISGSTTPVLEIIREMLASKERGRESEKDRAMQLLNLRLRTEEARKGRLQQELMFRERQTAEMEQALLKLNVMLGSIGQAQVRLTKEQENDSTKPVAEGGAVLELIKGGRVDEARDIMDKIERNVTRQKELKGELEKGYTTAKEYYEGIGMAGEDLYHAVRDYEKVKAGDWIERKYMGPMEVSEVEKQRALDILGEMSGAQAAGVRAGLDKYASEAIGRRMPLWLESLRAARVAAGQKPDFSEYIHDYKQWREGLIGLGRQLEMTEEEFAHIPDVLTSATAVTEARYKVLDEIAKMASEGKSDWLFGIMGKTDPDLVKNIEEWEKASDEGRIDDALTAAGKIYDTLSLPGGIDEEMRFNLIASDDEEKRYFGHLMRGVPILDRFIISQYPEEGLRAMKEEILKMSKVKEKEKDKDEIVEEEGLGIMDYLLGEPKGKPKERVKNPFGITPKGKQALKDLFDFVISSPQSQRSGRR